MESGAFGQPRRLILCGPSAGRGNPEEVQSALSRSLRKSLWDLIEETRRLSSNPGARIELRCRRKSAVGPACIAPVELNESQSEPEALVIGV